VGLGFRVAKDSRSSQKVVVHLLAYQWHNYTSDVMIKDQYSFSQIHLEILDTNSEYSTYVIVVLLPSWVA